MLCYLLYQLITNNIAITKDAINISIIAHLLVVFLGIWIGINSQESLEQFSDILKIVVVFLFFREADLSYVSLETIVKFITIGFIMAIAISMVDYYAYNSSHLKLNSVGSINRSATYIMYFFIIMLVLNNFFKSKTTRILLFIGLILSGASLVLGGSRMAMFSIPVVLFAYAFLDEKFSLKRISLLIASFLILLTLAIVLFPDSRVISRFDQGFSDPARIQIWLSSIYAWLEHNILFGIGVGNSISIDVHNYIDNARTGSIDNTHQLYLDMLLERGFLGFLTFFSFIFSLFSYGLQKEYKLLVRLLIFSLLLMGFANITFRYEFAILFVIIIASVLNPTIKKE
jgi:O-antigen ligase